MLTSSAEDPRPAGRVAFTHPNFVSYTLARFFIVAALAMQRQLVPEDHFSSAVAWTARSFQIATIAGPAIGGIAYALFRGPEGVYAIAVTVSILSTILTLRIHPRTASPEREPAERVAD